MPEDCVPYEPGDLVHLKGIPSVTAEKPAVIRGSSKTASGKTSYEIKLLEDNLSDYRKGYSLTTGITESEIREGVCRSLDTQKWKLSPEREAAKFAAIRIRTTPPSPTVIPDFERFKGVVDTLLGQLPEENVKKFAQTPDMALYTKVIKGGQTAAESKRFVEVVDVLLGELPQSVVEGFVKTPDYEVYKRVIEAAKRV